MPNYIGKGTNQRHRPQHLRGDLLSVVSEEPGAGGYELLPTSQLAAARGFQVPSLPSGQP